LPGHHVQLDVKFIAPIGAVAPRPASTATGAARPRRKKYYQYTAIDDCTRLRVLRIYEQNNQNTAIQFADYVLARLPFQVQVIQTDNGAEFQSAFPWHLLDGDPPPLHQARHSPPERQDRAQPPHRRRGVLPPARRRHD
jgi:hypothetical protein